MGNSYALKIKRIYKHNVLYDIIFKNDRKIIENVYYITKLNKYYVENFRKGTIINEFTICNVYTKKEYSVMIERVEAGFFFDGLEFSLEMIPGVNKVLVVSDVIEGGLSEEFGVKANKMLLLGNENGYFESINDIVKEIEANNAKFIFYDFLKGEVVRVDFEESRVEGKDLKLGFQVEEKFVGEVFGKDGEIVYVGNEGSVQEAESKDLNSLDDLNDDGKDLKGEVREGKECEGSNKEVVEICEEVENDVINHVINENNIDKENNKDKGCLFDSVDNEIITYNEKADNLNSNDSIGEGDDKNLKENLKVKENLKENIENVNLNTHNSIADNDIFHDDNLPNKIITANNLNSPKEETNTKATTKTENILEREDVMNFSNNNSISDEFTDRKIPEEFITKPSKPLIENNLSIHNYKNIIKSPNNTTPTPTPTLINPTTQSTTSPKISKIPSYENINTDTNIDTNIDTISNKSNTNTDTSNTLSNSTSKNKYNFNQIKKKYNKYLPIYDKIDSNFHFMNMNVNLKKHTKSISNSITQSNPSIISFEDEIKPSKPSHSITKSNKIVLIKSFSLANADDITNQSCIKLSSLAENTTIVNLIL